MLTAFPGWSWLALGTTGVLAFLPEFAFIGGAASNDVPAALFGTLALWGGFAIYRGDGRLRAGWWTPLALGLGLWTKVSTVAVWPVVGLGFLVGMWKAARARSDRFAWVLRRSGRSRKIDVGLVSPVIAGFPGDLGEGRGGDEYFSGLI